MPISCIEERAISCSFHVDLHPLLRFKIMMKWKEKKMHFFISKTTEPRRTITNRLESQWKKFTHSLRARTAYKDCHPPLWVLPNRYHTLPCCNCLHNICREALSWKGEGRGGAWQKIRKTQQHKTTLTWSCITTNLDMTITTIMSLRSRTTSQVVAWSP